MHDQPSFSLRRRAAALRLPLGVDAGKVAALVTRFTAVLAATLPGSGAVDLLSPMIEERDGRLVEAYPLVADETLWKAYQARGKALAAEAGWVAEDDHSWFVPMAA